MKETVRLVLKELIETLTYNDNKIAEAIVTDFNSKRSNVSTCIIDVGKVTDFQRGNRGRNIQVTVPVSIVFIYPESDEMIASYTEESITQEDMADKAPEILVEKIREDPTINNQFTDVFPVDIDYKPLRSEKLPNIYLSKIDLKVKCRWINPTDE